MGKVATKPIKMCKLVLLMQILLTITPTLITSNEQTSTTINQLAQSANVSSSVLPVKDFNNLILISDLLDVFNLGSVGRQWSQLSQRMTPSCRKDMTDYLYGLEKKKLWAIKSKLSIIVKFLKKTSFFVFCLILEKWCA